MWNVSVVHFVAPESPPGTIAAAVATAAAAQRRGSMLSPEPSGARLSRKSVGSPASGDPRFSRRTPDELYARLAIAKADVGAVGHRSLWAGHVLRKRAIRRPLRSPTREKLVKRLQHATTSAEGAARKRKAMQKKLSQGRPTLDPSSACSARTFCGPVQLPPATTLTAHLP